jgi:hypothetical protein
VESIPAEKIDRFIRLLLKMVRTLQAHQNLTIHLRISESYYLQRIEGLKLLQEQLDEMLCRLETIQGRIQEHYKNTYCQWKTDVRWLHAYLQKMPIL